MNAAAYFVTVLRDSGREGDYDDQRGDWGARESARTRPGSEDSNRTTCICDAFPVAAFDQYTIAGSADLNRTTYLTSAAFIYRQGVALCGIKSFGVLSALLFMWI